MSAVLPFPGESGQQRRLLNSLCALRDEFEITFLSSAPAASVEQVRHQLLRHADDSIVIPAMAASRPSRLLQRAGSLIYTFRTGLKHSNYVIGEREFSPERIGAAIAGREFDSALFEYWHSYKAAAWVGRNGIGTVLDTHNLLWQSYDRQLRASHVPAPLRRVAVQRYRSAEERAWLSFDAVVAISQGEYEVIKEQVPSSVSTYCVPMGLELSDWPYDWRPAQPPRLVYYGGLSSSHNQADAIRCANGIMPLVWRSLPSTELWIVGANPPAQVTALSSDARIKVTGFVDSVRALLSTATALICPWTGTYGFRSRLVEAMAVGVPVVASQDAVHGMGLDEGGGLLLGESDDELARHCLLLLESPDAAAEHSRNARRQVERKFSFQQTYGQFPEIMSAVARKRRATSGGEAL